MTLAALQLVDPLVGMRRGLQAQQAAVADGYFGTLPGDLIVMGDFNIPSTRSPLFKAITSKGLMVPTALAKQEALEAVGVRVGKTPSETARLLREVIASLCPRASGARRTRERTARRSW